MVSGQRTVSAVKPSVRYVSLFLGAIFAAGCLHEIGHSAAAWIIGVAAVPTPAKEYVLRAQLDWNKEIWIALGGPIGTTLAALAATLHFWRKPYSEREAVLAGALLPLGVYSLRFVLVGRGHDSTEWQAAQTALRLRPAGHAIDVFFLCLLVATCVVWFVRLRPPLWSLLRLTALGIAGVVFLVALQAGNNAVFDRAFPDVKIVNVPAGLDPR
jgi:hypothetical protein